MSVLLTPQAIQQAGPQEYFGFLAPTSSATIRKSAGRINAARR